MKTIIMLGSLLLAVNTYAFSVSYKKQLTVFAKDCDEAEQLLKKYIPKLKSYYFNRKKIIVSLTRNICFKGQRTQAQISAESVVNGLNIFPNYIEILPPNRDSQVTIQGEVLVRRF